MLPDKFGQVPLEFLRRWRPVMLFGAHIKVASPLGITVVNISQVCHKASGMAISSETSFSGRFEAAIRRFDELNAADPNLELVDGQQQPRELVYARRLTEWVLKLRPDASETLRLAARCQHLCRWTKPRDSYPMTRAGYLRWREELKKFHAQKADEVLREIGYEKATISRVQALNLKKDFPNDPECRVLEDALCLVFLEFQFAALAEKTTEEKMVNALLKAWNKMTPSARAEAMKLSFAPREKALLEKALSAAQPNSGS